MKAKIGILGGIGPESSALFYQALIKKVQQNKLKSNLEYPHIILESIPAPELLLENPDLNMYKDGIKNLEKSGADFIVIICNTAYLFLDKFTDLVNIPIINLEQETERNLKKKGISEITIFGSDKTINNLFKFKDIKINKLSEDDSLKIDKIILESNLGKNKEELLKQLKLIYNKYSQKNILIACTELSTMLKETDLDYLDTFDILLDSTYHKWKSLSK